MSPLVEFGNLSDQSKNLLPKAKNMPCLAWTKTPARTSSKVFRLKPGDFPFWTSQWPPNFPKAGK